MATKNQIIKRWIWQILFVIIFIATIITLVFLYTYLMDGSPVPNSIVALLLTYSIYFQFYFNHEREKNS